MSFTSLSFALFVPIVFVVYWFVLARSYRLQNLWLLAAGYVFYGWWDWRFLGLIFGTTFISWACSQSDKFRGALAALSVTVNIAILVVFKYFNFFGDGLSRLVATFGIAVDWFTVDVLLPVGISFYTFQAISYSIDVYKRKIAPAKDFLSYSVYIAFFPQLVAGPIERAQNLLPQFQRARHWDYNKSVQGMRQILWGLFKKCVVADGVNFWITNGYVTHINDTTPYGNFQCFLAVLGFALQIYGDFSGYSDIARGTARLFGIRLMDNFLYPFFSRNAIELWHRWHRSLMQWFTEYVYIPLGGSRTRLRYVNIMIVFLLSGLWHGADLSFVFWGVLCGVWYLIALLFKARKYRPGSDEAATRDDLPKIAFTFALFSLVFVLFYAETAEVAIKMYRHLIFPGLPIFAGIVLLAWIVKLLRMRFSYFIYILVGLCVVAAVLVPATMLRYTLGFAGYIAGALMLAVEWKSRKRSFALEKMPARQWQRVMIYVALYITVLSFVFDLGASEFIYFQF